MDHLSQERKDIGARIRKALESAGITNGQLGRDLDKKSTSAVSGWVSGRTQPSMEELARICQMTGVSSDWILGLDAGAPPPPPKVTDVELRRLVKKGRAFYEALVPLVARVERP